jgi:hypothetical protein
MPELKCPKCEGESIMQVNLQPITGDGTGVCRYCKFKAPLYVFRETYQNAQEHEPEYDPCHDENGYY